MISDILTVYVIDY